MLLIVPYHGMRFLMGNGQDFAGFSFTAFWLHNWRMGLFFSVSGFLTAMTLVMWGPTEQARRRVYRLGLPLLVGMLTILPLQRAVVVWDLNRVNPDGTGTAREWTFGNLFSLAPGHLWFLAYLLALNAVGLMIWMTVRRSPAIRDALDRGFRRLMASRFQIPVLAGISATLLATGGFRGAPGGVADSLIPIPAALAFYGAFFLFGWMLWRNQDLLGRVEDNPWSKLGLGVAAGVLAWLLFERTVPLPGALPGSWTVSFVAGFASWLTLFGVWGISARLMVNARPWLRYMADASYWIYLIHFLFLIIFQRLLIDTGMAPPFKLALATIGSVALALFTYATLVRYTAIGRVLHGPRERPTRAGPEPGGHPAVPARDT